MLESVSSFKHCGFSLSLYPPAAIITLSHGAFAIRCLERNFARSALFSGNTNKLDQLQGSGTFLFSMTRRIGRVFSCDVPSYLP